MATEKDVQEYYQELYNTDEKIVDFEKYMESEKESNNI
jgi:hypothetical protein